MLECTQRVSTALTAKSLILLALQALCGGYDE
jgi:hypothetical protein